MTRHRVVVGIVLAASTAHADRAQIEEAPPELQTVDLSVGAKNRSQARTPTWDGMLIQVPPGSTVLSNATTFGVTNGDTFVLGLSNKRADIAKQKRLIKANKQAKLDKFLLDQKDVIVWGTTGKSGAAWHFLANVTVGGAVFSCRDMASPHQHTSEGVMKMLGACRSMERARK